MYYSALVEYENGQYGLFFPHFPGCVALGDSLDEAMKDAREALAFHVEGMREDGERIPDASEFVEVDDELRNAQRVLVPLVEVLGKSERVNLSIDKGRLKLIDMEAARRGVSRSAFMVDAVMKVIK